MTDEENEKGSSNESFAVVGELVMISTALDWLLNRVLITMLDLRGALLLEPVVATLDPARKVEILKARAASMPAKDWKKGVQKFCDRVDSVFKQRNIACHTTPILKHGVWTFKPVAAAKMLKQIDFTGKTVHASSVNDFRAAIKTGESALGDGMNLIENFNRANAEKKRRDAAKKQPPS